MLGLEFSEVHHYVAMRISKSTNCMTKACFVCFTSKLLQYSVYKFLEYKFLKFLDFVLQKSEVKQTKQVKVRWLLYFSQPFFDSEVPLEFQEIASHELFFYNLFLCHLISHINKWFIGAVNIVFFKGTVIFNPSSLARGLGLFKILFLNCFVIFDTKAY